MSWTQHYIRCSTNSVVPHIILLLFRTLPKWWQPQTQKKGIMVAKLIGGSALCLLILSRLGTNGWVFQGTEQPSLGRQKIRPFLPVEAHLLSSLSDEETALNVSDDDGDEAPKTPFSTEEVDETDDTDDVVKDDDDETESPEPEPFPVPKTNEENLMLLQSLAIITNRGEKASNEQIDEVRSLVELLEAANPTTAPTLAKDLLEGTWELVFTDTKQLFRSSPFFMAGRAVCKDGDQADQYSWFCTMHRKALAISNIGPVRQVITPTQLISEFEVEAGAVPFLNDFTPFSYSGGIPLTVDGAIVSTADLTAINETAYELYMDTVQIKGSNLPVLRQLLDTGLQLQSRVLGDFLETNVDDYTNPRPVVRTTYLSDRFRISRDMDDNIFVYFKTSKSTEPKDYTSVDADLGVARLLEGFNDAVTKLYF